MGRPKALLPWSGGTVLDAILHAVEEAGLPPPVVVTGAHHRELSENLRNSSARIRENPDWASGMGSSIRCGLEAALETRPDLEGLLVLLADQPLVSKTYLLRLLSNFQSNEPGIVATRYPEGGGVPAIFRRSFFEALRSPGRSGGASSLIRSAASETLLLEPGLAGRDMDTPEKYRELRKIAGLPEIPGAGKGADAPGAAGKPGDSRIK
ncbi:nucleotidyltransferase family protein [Robiginitalea biformata]|nr:nucleotidyltransferase family protein [Robiginitalea biformata]